MLLAETFILHNKCFEEGQWRVVVCCFEKQQQHLQQQKNKKGHLETQLETRVLSQVTLILEKVGPVGRGSIN